MRRGWIALALIIMAVCFVQPGVARADDGKYVVVAGDTLFRIAQKHSISVDLLAAANGIANTSHIYVGQVLVIPSGQTAPIPTGDTPAQPAPPTENGYYTVQRGDTLNKISKAFNVTLTALMNANGIVNANLISVGQRLAIPGASTTTPPATNPPAAPTTPQTFKLHVVKAGEGLGKIGQRYGVSWQSIAAANDLPNPNIIHVGMVLKIPPPDATGAPAPSNPAAPVSSGKLIFVKLSEQRVYFYQNGVLLKSVVVSTGLPATPTVTVDYRIYVKYRSQTMYGPGYYLPDVPYVMYFYLGYGLHGTYWHSNWGRPMSHGCVNMPTEEARWLYNWAEVGTSVRVRW